MTARNSLSVSWFDRAVYGVYKAISQSSPRELGHTALGALGMIPVVGFVFDGANAIWYGFEGNWKDAALSGLAAIPGLGDAFALAKWGKQAFVAGEKAICAAQKFRATVRAIDAGVNIAQGAYGMYQGYTTGNYRQMGLGALGTVGNAFFLKQSIANYRKAPCFVAGTQVIVGLNADGSYQTKNIEDLQAGDWVWSRDQSSEGDDASLHQVARVFKKVSDHLRIVQIRDADGNVETIQTTDEHPFWVAGRGWTAARDLAAGDKLNEADDSDDATVVSSVREEHPEGVAVYNFEVQGDHTYFVEDGFGPRTAVWVHNQCFTDEAAKYARTNAQGHLENIDPLTGKATYSPRNSLAGDHMLPQKAFEDAIASYKAANNGKIRDELLDQLDDLMNGAANLRLMDRSFNSSKWNRSALEWISTPLGGDVWVKSPAYIIDLAARQEAIAAKVNQILGGQHVSSKYANQLKELFSF